MRREVADVRTLSLGTVDAVRRLDKRMDGYDRRLSELKDDLELMFKSELMGQLAHFETWIELTQSRLDARVEALEQR